MIVATVVGITILTCLKYKYVCSYLIVKKYVVHKVCAIKYNF